MNKIIYIVAISLFVLISCTTVQDRGTVKPSSSSEVQQKERTMLSRDEQAKEALSLFNTILEISQNEEREKAIVKMTELYGKIISDYPDAPLAQESYWRIIEIYLRDYDPPRIEEAMGLYREFLKKYDKSPVQNAIETTIERFFYSKSRWNDLLEFVRPKIEHFVSTSELVSPTYMFLHAEAKYNLGDYDEATKAYKIVIRYFPDSKDAKVSSERLNTIRKKK